MKTGAAFSDHIRTENIPKRRSFIEGSVSFRSGVLLFSLVLLSGILLIRLFTLQIVKGSYYRILSDSNRIRTKIIYAPRGVIFDRNHTPLVYNLPGFRLIKGEKTILLNREKALDLIANGATNISIDSLRNYPYKEVFAHVLGYIGQITKDELASEKYRDYLITDLVGKTGIEYEYEAFLKGVNGKQLLEVDATGEEIRMLGQTDPIPGQDLTLTLDAKLQQAAYQAMEHIERGAVVISTPKGEILTLISKPSFDPNLFTLDDTYQASNSSYRTVEEIINDNKRQPLLNRAISGVYPPGSTFKLVTAVAALYKNIIDESFKVQDTGVVRIGSFSFSNWFYTQYGKTDGDVDLIKGISRSNDIFFYKLAEKVGVTNLSHIAEQMGVGKKLGIDLPGEASGVLPTPEWKKNRIGEPWYLGDTYHYGIGQGYLLTTPLQVNAWTQAIANKGKIYRPHLLMNNNSEVVFNLSLSQKTVSLIREGMIKACSEGGTAWPLFNFRVKNSALRIDGKNFLEDSSATSSANAKSYRRVTIACKTGTAQHGGKESLPHAWITLFAPAYDPEIIVTVLVEEKGEGSSEAGPIAKKILDAWFSQSN